MKYIAKFSLYSFSILAIMLGFMLLFNLLVFGG